jgi:hypothetical protein
VDEWEVQVAARNVWRVAKRKNPNRGLDNEQITNEMKNHAPV